MTPPRGGRLARLARRAGATAVDYAVVCAPLALIGLLQSRRVRTPRPSPRQGGPGGARARLLVAVTVTTPLACGLAAAEATGGSPGKRLLRLQVRTRDTDSPVPYSAALLRTVLKTAIPWEIGHQAVWDFRGTSQTQRRGAVLAACAYAAVAAQAAMICTASGRTYADLLAGTVVVDAPGGENG
ncbi:RDD family protein [Microtetraspora malaysiensis]|uniref:RDD family protein n=1 Tax=Microtetraspora malaysiensis TaxID=161358 RepID=A0ABW6T6B3_9ACTN